MSQLFRLFLDIALWRRGPQDLPASKSLAWLVAVIYGLVSAAQVAVSGWNLRSGLLLVVLDLALQAAWLWGLLVYFGKRPRFLQGITAFLGVSALISLLDVMISLVLQSLGMSDSSPGNPWPVLRLGLVLLMLGRILQLTLERSLLMSMALTVVILLTISVVVQSLVPGM